MRKNVKFLLLGLLVFSLTATGWAAPGKATLRFTWWGNPTRDARTIEVIKMYMAKNPNVNIETETTGWAGYWDKLASQGAASNLPDIIQMDYAYISQYAKTGQLLDLASYTRNRKINLSKVPDVFISGGRINNKLYGISAGINAISFIYDPAILKKAGLKAPSPDWTWADFEKMATTIYQKTGVQTPPICATDPRVIFENMLRQTGKTFFNPKSGASLGFADIKLLIEFYQMQLRMLKSGVLTKPDVGFMSTTPDEARITKGKEWVGTGFWSNQVVMQQAAMDRPIGIALVPRINKSKRPGTYIKPSMFLSVAKSSAHKEEAVKFVNYFIENIEANKVLMAERGVPVVPTVRQTLKGLVDPVNRQVFEFLELVGDHHASPIDPPDPPGAGEVLKVFRTIDQEVLYGATAPKDAAMKFIKQGNQILAKNKK